LISDVDVAVGITELCVAVREITFADIYAAAVCWQHISLSCHGIFVRKY